MIITEFATLKIKAPYTVESQPLARHFLTLSASQERWSSYPLTFYRSVNEPSLIYLVTGWKDVAAHMEWIASDENKELLVLFEPFLSVEGLAHLDMNFEEIPLGSPILWVAKRNVDKDGQDSEKEGKDLKELEVVDTIWQGQSIDLEKSSDIYTLRSFTTLEIVAVLKGAPGVMVRLNFA